MSCDVLFHNQWKFVKLPVGAYTVETLDAGNVDWQAVDLPHDFLIYQTKNLYETCEGWYRRTYHYEPTGERVCLRFEGVYMNSTYYVNGVEVFTWKYGYSTFEFDITDALRPGANEITVRIVHQSPNSRWYSGAGIYRRVWLKRYHEKHILPDSVYASVTKPNDDFLVTVCAQTSLQSQETGVLCYRIVARDGAVVASAIKTVQGKQGEDVEMQVHKPMLWTLEIPTLYTLETELVVDGEVVDTTSCKIGFRTFTFSHDEGFFMNGLHMKLNGVCEHHDLGCLGAAVNPVALKRQLKILKQMGVNAIRTSHNMPATELMELADTEGFLIVSEAFDMWEKPKTEYDYARFFPEWAKKDVESWICRDRNHVSVVMWSIGNEIYDTHAGVRGQEVTRMLMEYVREYDYRGNAPMTIGSNFMPWENAQKCADIIQYAGYNYAEHLYGKHHAEHPDWFIYGSETSSVVQSRGVYHFPVTQPILSDDDEQCSALGNSTTSWGAKSPFACICDDRDAEFSLGQFIWTGFDYIGEPTPYHTKNSYFGQIDTAGFPKDSYYFYQAEWTDYHNAPMIHITPYWDFCEGQMIDVRVCSNAPHIELYLNDRLIGKKDIDHVKGRDLTGDWKIPYEKGVLRAVAYDEKGEYLCEEVRRSFGDATRMILTPDKKNMLADGQDLIFVEISMEDREGNPVENANNRVTVTVTGAGGRLVGLDNGDSTDFDEYKCNSRRLFSGKLLAVIAANTTSGDLQLRVSSVGMEDAVLDLYAYETTVPEGISSTMGVMVCEENPEVPVRKIEIIASEGTVFTPEKKTMQVQAKLLPENATYREVEWRITNDAGVDTNLAELIVDPEDTSKCTITAKGDGCFRVRCLTRNGRDKVSLYAQLEFTGEGLGVAYHNPYELIAGALFNHSSGNVGPGNDRGVSMSRDGESFVTFDGINFGDYGSDCITIPIFELESREINFEIWLGKPEGLDSECLGMYYYNKPSIWNVYQEETFQLPRRLTGMQTISFRFWRKAHIKGFYFEKPKKAWALLTAKDNSRIYGDSFTIEEDAITGIGNNVSLEYHEMDFGDTGFTKLVICGRSALDKNTIHVRFAGAEGEVRQLAEFKGSAEYVEQTFVLEPVYGENMVTFIFLPGCDFDFKWFRFEK